MDYYNFIGIDVSKKTLDVAYCCLKRPEVFHYIQIANSKSGFSRLMTWLKKLRVDLGKSFFAMEHTGIYSLPISCFLQGEQLHFALYNPLEIKRSLGLQRGKNDRIDAKRIAYYIFLHRHELKVSRLAGTCLSKLKNFLAFRDRLVKTKTTLQTTLGELKQTDHILDSRFIIEATKEQLYLIKEQIKKTEKKIRETIDSEEDLKMNFKLACTVPGIGLVTAAYFLVHTHNFKAFENGRQFAAYSGIAPYEHSSGSSIRGRARNSPLANKKMKALLANGANSAIFHDNELKGYFWRKVEEGKPKMLVINAVKAKMVQRVFATVKRGSGYVDIKKYAA